MSNGPKPPKLVLLSPALEEKLNSIQSDIAALHKSEEKNKKISRVDLSKFIGTFIVLFIWGIENYWIKPQESAKLEQQANRMTGGLLNAKTERNALGSSIFTYIMRHDSSAGPTVGAISYEADCARSIENEIYFIQGILDKPSEDSIEWLNTYNSVHRQNLRTIDSLKKELNFYPLQLKREMLTFEFNRLSEKYLTYNKEWYAIGNRIRDRRKLWAIGYIIGSIFLIASIIPQRK